MTTQGVVLAPIYGATEFGGPTYMSKRPGGTENDWEWMSIDERTGIHWEPQGDGTYECQFIVRSPSSVILYLDADIDLHLDQ